MVITVFVVLFIISVVTLLMIRNKWVYRTRVQLLELVHARTLVAIRNEEVNWRRYYIWLNSLPSYDRMMFLISVWDANKFLDTFPDCIEEE